jgi:hypothetical protein
MMGMVLLLVILQSFSTNGFLLAKTQHRLYHSAAAVTTTADIDTAFLTDPNIVTVRNATCTLVDKPVYPTKRRRCRFWKRSSTEQTATYHFDYNYNQVVLRNDNNNETLTAILLIHPIGVGIGRWFYNRLLHELYTLYSKEDRVVVLAPDLLACGSASNPIFTTTNDDSIQQVGKLPLFNVTDWASQIQQLMAQYEESLPSSTTSLDWCLVSNGGCVPIALDILQSYCESSQQQVLFKGNLTNIVLSAPPRLSGLLQYPPPATKVKKSYRILSSTVAGRLFWWYSLRNDGAFIQKFSENNLAASADNLGEEWTPICVATATLYPKSRYSTFCFLAGALQQSCQPAFDALQHSNKNESASAVTVDVILGGDK